MADDETKVYALNLFDIADRGEYLAYSRRSAREVARHGGRVLALGRFRESAAGDITPCRCSSWSNGNPGRPSRATVRTRRWPTCTRTGSEVPRRMCGTCSTGWMTCGRSFAREPDRRNTHPRWWHSSSVRLRSADQTVFDHWAW